ncbi:MAG: tail fiber domain-containing protein [Bacteroidia bacterium]
MRKHILTSAWTQHVVSLLLIISLLPFLSFAQAPEKMNYQGVARDNSGNVLASQSIGLRITLHSGSPSGTTVYQETHSITTNTFGLFAIEIGGGTVVSGTIAGINWGNNSYYVQTEMDASGGSNYSNMGTAQLISVPYALYAKNAGGGSAGWGLTGNSGTNPGTNFIGTTDAKALVFKTNNYISGRIDYDTPFNTSYGNGALAAITTGQSNTAIGMDALLSNTTGSNNTALGLSALGVNTIGIDNTAVGSSALYANTQGDYNTAVGTAALSANTTGESNVAIGSSALYTNTTGANNTALGNLALYSNTTGNTNVAVGTGALTYSQDGDFNIAVGNQALNYNAHGNKNIAIGGDALYYNSWGNGNTATGFESMYRNTFASYNTAYGYQSLYNNEEGEHNTAIGYRSLYNSTGDANTALGEDALYTNLGGDGNTAVGHTALYSNTSGNSNTAAGIGSLYSNINGSSNSAFGNGAMKFNTDGTANTAAGYEAMRNNTSGYDNTAVGKLALETTTIGYGNSAFGGYAGGFATISNYCTAVGYSAGQQSTTQYTGSSAFGYQARYTGDNQVVLGNVGIASIGGYEDWTNLSDSRYKKNIAENVKGLDFIMKLRPVTYNYAVNDLAAFLKEDQKRDEQGNIYTQTLPHDKAARDAKEQQRYTGFIAQEVEVAAKEMGFDFSGVDAPQNEQDLYGLRYATFTVPLVKAVQELAKQNEEMKKEIELLKSKLK